MCEMRHQPPTCEVAEQHAPAQKHLALGRLKAARRVELECRRVEDRQHPAVQPALRHTNRIRQQLGMAPVQLATPQEPNAAARAGCRSPEHSHT